jgi:hypothetical protein
MTGNLFELCLQSLSSKKSHNEGREILGLDICNDDSQGQAWSFSIPVPENEISYTVHNGFLKFLSRGQ